MGFCNHYSKQFYSSYTHSSGSTSTTTTTDNSTTNSVSSSTTTNNNGTAAPGTTSTTTTTPEYKRPTPPTGVPLSKIFNNIFPLSYSESYNQWSTSKLDIAEHNVLSHLPFYPHTDGTRTAQSLQIPIYDGSMHINEFEITRTNEKVDKNLVVLHGYGAGLAFYYRNLDKLSSLPGWKTHALDLLGYGRSSRPKFKIRARGLKEAIVETEQFFIDALEQWRISKGIEKFTLVAHSMGAYLGASYATKYPGRVEKLMMVSPAGVPRSEYSLPLDGSKPKPLLTKSSTPLWFHYLWESHVSPFSLVRNTGPLGPRFVSGWTSRRFANLPTKQEAQDLHLYTYQIFNAPGSGEYALNYLLAPGAHGRRPLAERASEIPCDTQWVYGTHDWMDINGGIEAVETVHQHTNYNSNVIQVTNSGHHIYLDNPNEFNQRVLEFITS